MGDWWRGIGDLPDLSPILPGLERRRHRRSPRHHRAAALCRRPRRRRDLALADLHLADGRHGLRRLRLYRHRPDLRLARRLRRDGRPRPRARPQGHHRPGAVAFVRPASVLPGEPVKPRQSEGRLVRLGRPQARRLAAQQLALDLRRTGLGLGHATAAVLLPQLPRRAARLQLPQSRGAGLAARDDALLAGARASTASASTRSTSTSTTSCLRDDPADYRTQDRGAGQSLRDAVSHLLEEPAGEPRLPRARCAASSTSTRRGRWSARSARATTRSA